VLFDVGKQGRKEPQGRIGVSTGGPPSILQWQRMAKEAEFNCTKLAWLCGVSERHLQRIFRKHVGCSPHKWLRDLQCRLAKDLILRGYSSKAAAAELKFSTPAHFCREFKKAFGAAPQTFGPNASRAARLADVSWGPGLKFHPTLISAKNRKSKIPRLLPEIEAEIKFAEWTAGNVLRHAEFVAVREMWHLYSGQHRGSGAAWRACGLELHAIAPLPGVGWFAISVLIISLVESRSLVESQCPKGW
jgi:AraC-like DNA-binding protein